MRLDDSAAALAVKTAKARLSDLQAALDERNLAVTVVKSEITRVEEEQRFVDKEFERTHVLFQRGLVN